MHAKRVDIVLLMIVSAVLLIIGLNSPVLTTRKLWEKNTFSILSGITNLWTSKYYFLSAIIFFFSIIFPIFKLCALFTIWYVKLGDRQRIHLLRILEMLGKWSMLDVFVVAVIVVSVKLGALASARAEKGIYYFGFSILLAIIASSLQTRLARH